MEKLAISDNEFQQKVSDELALAMGMGKDEMLEVFATIKDRYIELAKLSAEDCHISVREVLNDIESMQVLLRIMRA